MYLEKRWGNAIVILFSRSFNNVFNQIGISFNQKLYSTLNSQILKISPPKSLLLVHSNIDFKITSYFNN